MDQQFIMPGQPPLQSNNNPAPTSQYPPSSEFNGIQNANLLSQFSNGSNGSDVSQKLQNLNLSQEKGSKFGQPQVIQGQLPPGVNFPPNFAQVPTQQSHSLGQDRPPTSGASGPQGQFPSSSQPAQPATQPQVFSASQGSGVQPGFPSSSSSVSVPPMQSGQPLSHPMDQITPISMQGQMPPRTIQSQIPPMSMQHQSQLQPMSNQNQLPPHQRSMSGQLPPVQGQQIPPMSQFGLLPQPITSQAAQNLPPQSTSQSQQLPPQSKSLVPPSQGPPSMNMAHVSQTPTMPLAPPVSQTLLQGQKSQPGQQSGGNTPQQGLPKVTHPGQQQGQLALQPGQFPGQIPPQQGQLSQQTGIQANPPQNVGQMSPQQLPPQSVQKAPQQGHHSTQPGHLPLQSGQLSSHSGQKPPQPGQPALQPGQMQFQPGQLPQHSGQLPGLHGQFQTQPSQIGQPPQQLGQIAHQPRQVHPQTGQLPSQPQLPPQASHLPPQPGQLPPQQGRQPLIPPIPGQGPPQMGQQPQMPGQYGRPPIPGQQQTGQIGFTQPPIPGPGVPPGPPMAGLPHMPPPVGQNQQRYPPGEQPAFGAHPPPPQQQYSGMPPTSQQPGHPPYPGQQPQYPGQQPQYPGQQPQYPGQQPQYPGQQPQYPGQQPQYPGQQQQYPGQQPQYPSYQQPEQPVKRLDPDQMPSPVQVMVDDQANRSGLFVTNERGVVPPLVTTDFTVDDQGNSSPRYIRSSMYSVPVTADLLKQTAVPFCVVISPMAETVPPEREPPLLDFAALTNSPAMGPVRCCRCKAYMCPAMKFIDAGRHFKCAFCKATTEVPMEYTQYVNSMQQYGRTPAEMALGTYEIVATKEYCRNNSLPKPPAIVFLIDVSYNAVKCGLVHVICANIRGLLESLPRDDNGVCHTRVGFITFSTTIHFYNIKGTLGQPQMLSVGDVADVFVPLLEGFLVKVDESATVLDSLMQQIPLMFQDNKETEIILLPAVQAGLEALKAADTSGQLIVFHTSLPTLNAPGKLANREDRKLLATDKEKLILNPQTTAYNELGQSLSQSGVSCELFLLNNSYIDAATIGQLARLTGGGVNKYTYFTADMDGFRLIEDVRRVLCRPTGYDAVMRVRTSTGVRATDFYGHIFMSNTTDVELAAVDADKAVSIEIKHDDKLTAEDGVYIQAALLYTHFTGQRRLRVFNLALNVAHQLADVYRSCELDTIINVLSKQGVMALREGTPRAVRDALSARCARSLATYRRHCASPSSAGQLVLPESMKLLPLYTSCLLRSDALAGGPDITCDDRSVAMYRALTADVETSLATHYPRLLPLHRIGEVAGNKLPVLRASIDKMQATGVYLLENGVHMLLWIGSQASPEFLQDVFGVQSHTQIDTQVQELPQLDNETSEAVRQVVDDSRRMRRRCMRLTVMRQHDKLEAVLRHFLVEDRGVDGSASYVDFLCHVHKEIRALL